MYDCTPVRWGCQIKRCRKRGGGSGSTISVAGLAVGGLKLVQLRIPLRCKFSLRSLAVQIGTWAIVKSRVKIDPNLGIGIASVFRRRRSFGQSQANEHPVK